MDTRAILQLSQPATVPLTRAGEVGRLCALQNLNQKRYRW
jgi:hypothetical protein